MIRKDFSFLRNTLKSFISVSEVCGERWEPALAGRRFPRARFSPIQLKRRSRERCRRPIGRNLTCPSRSIAGGVEARIQCAPASARWVSRTAHERNYNVRNPPTANRRSCTCPVHLLQVGGTASPPIRRLPAIFARNGEARVVRFRPRKTGRFSLESPNLLISFIQMNQAMYLLIKPSQKV